MKNNQTPKQKEPKRKINLSKINHFLCVFGFTDESIRLRGRREVWGEERMSWTGAWGGRLQHTVRWTSTHVHTCTCTTHMQKHTKGGFLLNEFFRKTKDFSNARLQFFKPPPCWWTAAQRCCCGRQYFTPWKCCVQSSDKADEAGRLQTEKVWKYDLSVLSKTFSNHDFQLKQTFFFSLTLVNSEFCKSASGHQRPPKAVSMAQSSSSSLLQALVGE